jgi:mono/diheme cytochrome c family protein
MRKARLIVAAGVLVLVAIAGAVFAYRVTREAVQLRATGRNGAALATARASLDRGEYLYQTAARCATCHARDLGGAFVLRSELVATLWGPNLTRGNPSVGVSYTNADFERAIRRGLRPNGMRLLGMPSLDYATMSDDDVSSVIAYIRAAKTVERPAPAFRLGIGGRLMLLTGRLGFDSDRIPDAVPPQAPRSAGAYLGRIGGCLRCHGAGGETPAVGLDVENFTAVLQNGRDGSGREISAHAPPARRWRDADVGALYWCFAELVTSALGPTCSGPVLPAR